MEYIPYEGNEQFINMDDTSLVDDPEHLGYKKFLGDEIPTRQFHSMSLDDFKARIEYSKSLSRYTTIPLVEGFTEFQLEGGRLVLPYERQYSGFGPTKYIYFRIWTNKVANPDDKTIYDLNWYEPFNPNDNLTVLVVGNDLPEGVGDEEGGYSEPLPVDYQTSAIALYNQYYPLPKPSN